MEGTRDDGAKKIGRKDGVRNSEGIKEGGGGVKIERQEVTDWSECRVGHAGQLVRITYLLHAVREMESARGSEGRRIIKAVSAFLSETESKKAQTCQVASDGEGNKRSGRVGKCKSQNKSLLAL